MSELLKRILSAAVLIPVVFFLIFWENSLAFAVAIYLVIILGNMEMIRLAKSSNLPASPILFWLGALAVYPCFHLPNSWQLLGFVIVGIIFLTFAIKLFSETPTDDVMSFISVNIFGALFFPLFFSFMWLIRDFNAQGSYLIFFLCVIVWLSDSCAYFVGRAIGKRKIVPKVSPKKSLEGFIAGAIGGVGGGVAFYYLFLAGSMELSIVKVIIISVDVVAAGMLGDLFESMLKRSAGVKDSGNVIPGHGGILDRMDSLMFAAPVLFMYLSLWG
ncbi:MAG: phosphatidate cytidylyltransferase [Deferribacteraceae bacterium]|jgi:phosphatidate cytidylyltransferase|nr:phosphatidate cytidylyltransferase [Deferribacteraceae bacterium]